LEEILLMLCVALGGAMFILLLRKISHRFRAVPRGSQIAAPKQVDFTKSQIESLEFERSILSHSIASAYEFMHRKDMSPDRDRLVTKYKSQLLTIDEKIGELQLSVEFADLSETRNNLVSLLQTKITSLDTRLSELSRKYGVLQDNLADGRDIHFETRYHLEPQSPKLNEANGEKGGITESKSEDLAVREVQQEIMQALTRLENAGTDYELTTESNQTEPSANEEREFVNSSHIENVEHSDKNNVNHFVSSSSSIGRDAVSCVNRFKSTY